MDARADIREFLTTRRAKITPEAAGLPAYGGGRRRVAGLRREEVALLAGISVEYYTRLERGTAAGVSEDVLDGIARALQLDDAERDHLLDLVRSAGAGRPPRRRPVTERIRPSVQRVLDSLSAPAFVRNGRLDILAANPVGYALHSELYVDPVRPANYARFTFLSPRATRFFPDWERIAGDTVAILRSEAGRDPYDRRLSDLIGELSTRSDDFRVRWAAHDVKYHDTGTKRFRHPLVGDLTVTYEHLDLAADPGQALFVYTAEPGSASADALALLASWAATPDAAPAGGAAGGAGAPTPAGDS